VTSYTSGSQLTGDIMDHILVKLSFRKNLSGIYALKHAQNAPHFSNGKLSWK